MGYGRIEREEHAVGEGSRGETVAENSKRFKSSGRAKSQTHETQDLGITAIKQQRVDRAGIKLQGSLVPAMTKKREKRSAEIVSDSAPFFQIRPLSLSSS